MRQISWACSWRILLAVGLTVVTGAGLGCEKSGNCQLKVFQAATAIPLAPGETDSESGACSTCGHAAGSATWTVSSPAPDVTGFVRIHFDYSCNGNTFTSIVSQNVPVSAGAFRTADQGVKNICGENAPVVWKVWLVNDTALDLSVRLAVSCPVETASLLSRNVLAPSTAGR